MIFPLAGLILGLIWGGWRAKNRQGSRADMAQWALVHGIGLMLVGLFVLIAVDRLLL